MSPRRTASASGVSPLWTAWRPHRIGNRLFIDFVNTAYRETEGHDPLAGWLDLVHFLRLAEALPEAELDALDRIGSNRAPGAETAAAMAEARRLRAALKALTAALVSSRPARAEWVKTINRALAAADGGVRLRAEGNRWRLASIPAAIGPRLALAPIARSAADFLANDDVPRLRRCAAPACVLYFYDISRNGRRRWCRMALCGNRAKARAHLNRRAAGESRRPRAKV
jgi:predicted RNA-binding Zn ribbon-like protein